MGATVKNVQDGWRWCSRCEGLFFNSPGRCPAGGGHVNFQSGIYQVPLSGGGQPNWRRCRKCEGLFFFGNSKPDGFPSVGRCPSVSAATGSGHEPDLLNNFFPDLNNFFADLGSQPDWRWCRRCEGLFFSGHPSKGRCPAGGVHDGSQSGNYNLFQTP
jgi:hypothetical protein